MSRAPERLARWWQDAPHEPCLLALGTTLTLWLAAGATLPDAASVGAASALYALTCWLCGRDGWLGWRLRYAAAYGYTLWVYDAIQWITPALGLTLRDDALLAIDVWALGQTPALTLQAHTSLALSELLSLCYLSYHVYLHGALLHALTQTRAQARALYTYLFVTFALGIAGYLVVPAVGPVRALTFDAPLPSGPITRFQEQFIGAGSSIYDVFPSLHILLTAALLLHDWRAARLRAAIMLPIALGLTASTLYLRYHYAVDLIAGAALALAVRAWFVRREAPDAEESHLAP